MDSHSLSDYQTQKSNLMKDSFSKHYKLKKACLLRGECFEIREIQTTSTPPIRRAAKIYRKLELPGAEGGKISGREIVENDLKLLSRVDHPNILKV